MVTESDASTDPAVTTPHPNLKRLLSMVKGKKVSLITHWDADGVTSGALIYHLIKDVASEVHTSSKGDVFLVKTEDVEDDSDIIIATDITPSDDLPADKVVYIDHHPHPDADRFGFSIHNPDCQSTSLLIWEQLIPTTTNPYFLFLSLLGYFGDIGKREEIPIELWERANELIPEMLVEKKSRYRSGTYLEIERFVPPLNTGKRWHWSGDLPLEMLKNIRHHKLFVDAIHPIADQLNQYRTGLARLYRMSIDVKQLQKIDYAQISSNRNIQGVLCARYMKVKPIMVLNKFNGSVIGSMRVPDETEFDAGDFLNQFNDRIPSFLGGGHEKAGGFTFDSEHVDHFIEELEKVG
ncbi:MAG: DHHA1 domain-containing protein [archaeon]